MLSSVLERRLSTNPAFLHGQLTGTTWAFGLAFWKVKGSIREPVKMTDGVEPGNKVVKRSLHPNPATGSPVSVVWMVTEKGMHEGAQ